MNLEKKLPSIQKEIEDSIANLMIENYESTISGISVSVSDGKIKIDMI